MKRHRESVGNTGRGLGRMRWVGEGSEGGEQAEAEMEAETERRKEESREEEDRREAERRDAERREAERRFEEEEQRHMIIRAEQRRERTVREGVRVEEIEEVFQCWVGQCGMCKAQKGEGDSVSRGS